jgi:hypothetical protein
MMNDQRSRVEITFSRLVFFLKKKLRTNTFFHIAKAMERRSRSKKERSLLLKNVSLVKLSF